MGVQDRIGPDHVAHVLAHFLAAAVQDEAEADNVAVGGFPLEQGCQGVEAVEPAAGLVHGFTDVVGREPSVLVNLGVVEGIVPLGEGHGAGIEPGVHDLGDAMHGAAAAVQGAGNNHLVHIGAVQVEVVQAGVVSRTAQFRSSSRLPTQTRWLQSRHCQMGMGVPQYLSREMAQSTLLRSHSPNRPSRM